jgi:hypothetical protein
LALVSHDIDTMFRSPLKRPSTSCTVPKVFKGAFSKGGVGAEKRTYLPRPSDVVFRRDGVREEVPE